MLIRNTLIVAGASFALAWATVGPRPRDAFYLLPPRAWELLCGSLAALAGRRYDGVDWSELGLHCSETERRADGKFWNVPLEVYPNVSQFWKYKPEEYLKQPSYSRTFQGIKKG